MLPSVALVYTSMGSDSGNTVDQLFSSAYHRPQNTVSVSSWSSGQNSSKRIYRKLHSMIYGKIDGWEMNSNALKAIDEHLPQIMVMTEVSTKGRSRNNTAR